MNYCLLGIFSLTRIGIFSAIFYALTHALISTALFLIADTIYKRTGSRDYWYARGFIYTAPVLAIF